MDYQSQRDFQTYNNPHHVDVTQYDRKLNVTKTRHNNPANLTDLLQQRMAEYTKERDELLYMDDDQYVISPEHDSKINPLSHINMLGEEMAKTIDPTKKNKLKKNGELVDYF
jgi:DNA recombination-dependent growth factor C